MPLHDITFGVLNQRLDLLQQLRRYMEMGITDAHVAAISEWLEYALTMHHVVERPEVISEVQRVTINRRILRRNARLTNVSYLKYPPPEFANYGRCNMRHHSVLYAGFDFLTILSELKPELGDLITVSYWRNKEMAPMRCTTVVGHQPSEEGMNLTTFEARQALEQMLDQYPPNQRTLFYAQTEFLADAFARRVAPRPAVNYLFTAYFASKLLGPPINFEAIKYASVQQRLALNNIAIRADVFDQLFEFKEAKEMIVTGTPYGETATFRGMFAHGTATARETGADGRLNWVTYGHSDETTRIIEEFGINLGDE